MTGLGVRVVFKIPGRLSAFGEIFEETCLGGSGEILHEDLPDDDFRVGAHSKCARFILGMQLIAFGRECRGILDSR
jgi:hypothetical protein